jgi:hypothetical protein
MTVPSVVMNYGKLNNAASPLAAADCGRMPHADQGAELLIAELPQLGAGVLALV